MRALLAAIGLLLLGGASYTAIVWKDGPPSAARDLDCDGVVSLSEWYSAGLNDGWRSAIDGTPGCMEVFALKDGLPIVCVCAQEPRCRPARNGCSDGLRAR
jgi:hypothetical protein